MFGLGSFLEMSAWGALFTWRFLAVVCFTGLFSTALAMYMENWALSLKAVDGQKLMPPVHAGVITAFEPFATVFVSLLLLNEVVTPLHLVGGVVVVLANTLEPLRDMWRAKKTAVAVTEIAAAGDTSGKPT